MNSNDLEGHVFNIYLGDSAFFCRIQHEGDRGSTVVKVLCYNSEVRWFDPSWCQWIFH